MISAPPIKSALLQFRPRVDFVRYDVFSIRPKGASGVVVIIAPFPAFDSIEDPYIFLATTFA